jgi:hypothetical protein
MITLAATTQSTTASSKSIYKLWEDINHWADYDQGIEWAKLNEPFVSGSHYTLKPKGGPKVKATILEVEPGKTFVDVSHLLGANLRFDHTIKSGSVSITMTLSGPLSWLWAKILGKNQQADLERSTANLISKAEGRS